MSRQPLDAGVETTLPEVYAVPRVRYTPQYDRHFPDLDEIARRQEAYIAKHTVVDSDSDSEGDLLCLKQRDETDGEEEKNAAVALMTARALETARSYASESAFTFSARNERDRESPELAKQRQKKQDAKLKRERRRKLQAERDAFVEAACPWVQEVRHSTRRPTFVNPHVKLAPYTRKTTRMLCKMLRVRPPYIPFAALFPVGSLVTLTVGPRRAGQSPYWEKTELGVDPTATSGTQRTDKHNLRPSAFINPVLGTCCFVGSFPPLDGVWVVIRTYFPSERGRVRLVLPRHADNAHGTPKRLPFMTNSYVPVNRLHSGVSEYACVDIPPGPVAVGAHQYTNLELQAIQLMGGGDPGTCAVLHPACCYAGGHPYLVHQLSATRHHSKGSLLARHMMLPLPYVFDLLQGDKPSDEPAATTPHTTANVRAGRNLWAVPETKSVEQQQQQQQQHPLIDHRATVRASPYEKCVAEAALHQWYSLENGQQRLSRPAVPLIGGVRLPGNASLARFPSVIANPLARSSSGAAGATALTRKPQASPGTQPEGEGYMQRLVSVRTRLLKPQRTRERWGRGLAALASDMPSEDNPPADDVNVSQVHVSQDISQGTSFADEVPHPTEPASVVRTGDTFITGIHGEGPSGEAAQVAVAVECTSVEDTSSQSITSQPPVTIQLPPNDFAALLSLSHHHYRHSIGYWRHSVQRQRAALERSRRRQRAHRLVQVGESLEVLWRTLCLGSTGTFLSLMRSENPLRWLVCGDPLLGMLVPVQSEEQRAAALSYSGNADGLPVSAVQQRTGVVPCVYTALATDAMELVEAQRRRARVHRRRLHRVSVSRWMQRRETLLCADPSDSDTASSDVELCMPAEFTPKAEEPVERTASPEVSEVTAPSPPHTSQSPVPSTLPRKPSTVVPEPHIAHDGSDSEGLPLCDRSPLLCSVPQLLHRHSRFLKGARCFNDESHMVQGGRFLSKKAKPSKKKAAPARNHHRRRPTMAAMAAGKRRVRMTNAGVGGGRTKRAPKWEYRSRFETAMLGEGESAPATVLSVALQRLWSKHRIYADLRGYYGGDDVLFIPSPEISGDDAPPAPTTSAVRVRGGRRAVPLSASVQESEEKVDKTAAAGSTHTDEETRQGVSQETEEASEYDNNGQPSPETAVLGDAENAETGGMGGTASPELRPFTKRSAGSAADLASMRKRMMMRSRGAPVMFQSATAKPSSRVKRGMSFFTPVKGVSLLEQLGERGEDGKLQQPEVLPSTKDRMYAFQKSQDALKVGEAQDRWDK